MPLTLEPIAKVKLLGLRRRYTPRNDRKDTICHCEQSEAIPLLNTFAITSSEYKLKNYHRGLGIARIFFSGISWLLSNMCYNFILLLTKQSANFCYEKIIFLDKIIIIHINYTFSHKLKKMQFPLAGNRLINHSQA